ncbi:MAG: hypothetical protein Q8R50_14070 [Sediminibacterium sp.]|nr:hypothetical protein [Sediminibacterium sp.]
MIIDINKLKKIDDILNSEGTVLGLYQIANEYVLSSFLSDKSGVVYYSTNLETLKKYLTSEINLKLVYIDSEDFIVTKKYRHEKVSYIKQDLADLIQCGDKLYSEISESMKNDKIVNQLYGS